MSVKYNNETIAGKYKTQIIDTSKFATKDEVNDLLEEKANTSDIPDVSNFITMDNVEEKGYLTEVPSEYITQTELDDKGYARLVDIQGKADASTVNEQLELKSDKSNTYTKSEVDDKIADAVTGGQIDLSGYAKDGEVVHLANAETITGAKTFTQPLKIQNGAGTGSLLIGGDVNAGTVTNGARKLARIAVPTQANKDLTSILLGFDSNGDDALSITNRGSDNISFGGSKKITNATSPMSISFCVAKERNATDASKKTYALEMDANEARFNSRPNYNGVNLATTVDVTNALGSYAKLTDIPDVSNFATKEELNDKQDTLTAGENITIENGVISGTVDLGNYYNKGEVDDLLDDKLENQSNFKNLDGLSIGEDNTDSGKATIIGFRNTADGVNGILIGSDNYANAINNVCIGEWCEATGNNSICIGNGACTALENSIQLGEGFNTTPNSFQVSEHQLLNIETGKIPDERLSENIATKEDLKNASVSVVDSETIINNTSSGLDAIGVKSKDGSTLYDWIGTKEEYEAGIADGTISEDWICWVTDNEGDDKCRSMPIGMIYSLNCTEDYIPDGSLPCNGSEYTSSQFKALWDNYLTGEEIDKIITVDIFGALTNNNGILSGFSSNSYFKLKNIPSELIVSFIPTDVTNKQMLFTDVSSAGRFRIENGSLYEYYYANAGVVEKEEICTLTINKPFQLRLKNLVDNKYNTVGIYIDNRMIREETGIGIKADINFGYGVSTSYETSSNTGWNNSAVYPFSGTIDISSNTYKTYNTLLNTCTYEEYEQDLSVYGQCYKFAVDTENLIFKVPTITKMIANIDDTVGVRGNEMTLGFTDGTALVGLAGVEYSNYRYIGYKTDYYATNIGTEANTSTGSYLNKTVGLTTDASKSGIIADTTNAKTYLELRYFVVIANGQINQSMMDWAKWLEGLSSKVDKSNLTECAVVVRVSDRSIAPSWYRIWSDGWCEQGGRLASATSQTVELLIEMSDINYCLTFGPYATTSTDTEGWDMNVGSSDYTTTSFRVTSVASRNDNWKVEGYMKE